MLAHLKRKNLQMLVYVCKCEPIMVKCTFSPPNILKIATHLATYGRKIRKNVSFTRTCIRVKVKLTFFMNICLRLDQYKMFSYHRLVLVEMVSGVLEALATLVIGQEFFFAIHHLNCIWIHKVVEEVIVIMAGMVEPMAGNF